MTKETDEINPEYSSTSNSTEELHTGGYNNEWGTKLNEFATNVSQFNTAFTPGDLGEGQFMSAEECAKQVSRHNSRQRAGTAANAKLDADLTWADVRIKEEKVIGKQLTRGIHRAKNVILANELAYQVGVIPLHGEARTLQLKQLSNKVQMLRNSVKSSSQFVAMEGASEGSNEVDFNTINVEADEVIEE
jgi:hypothetical protein